METWNANLKAALVRGAKPTVKAEMRGMSTAFLEVRDYTAGAGDSFSVVRNGTTLFTLTEGTHFDAEVSNEQTAINIAFAAMTANLAIPINVSRVGSRLKIRAGGTGTLSMVTTTTDANAWTEYRTGFPNRIAWCSDARACGGRYGAELLEMGSSGSEFDIEDRSYRLAAFDITLSAKPGSWARALVTSVPVVGQVVEISLGTVELAESDYERIATMVVMDYGLGDETVTLQLAEPQVYAADRSITAHVLAMHPLDLIKWAYSKAGLPSSFLESASLDPASYPEISHWLVSAHSYHWWSKPPMDKKPPSGFVDAKAGDIISEALKILPGMVRRDSAGELEYLKWDRGASRVRHFERQDWESVAFDTLTENRYTRVLAVAADSELFGGDKRAMLRIADSAVGNLTGADEEIVDEPYTLPLESKFFGTPAWVRAPQTGYAGIEPSATMLQVWCGPISGLSGCRTEDPELSDDVIAAASDRPNGQRVVLHTSGRVQATQRAGDEIDNAEGRVGYYLLTDGGQSEVVEVTLTEPPDIADPDTSPQYWYRPGAFVPEGSGDTAVVTSGGFDLQLVSLDTTAPFTNWRQFPFVVFQTGTGNQIRRIVEPGLYTSPPGISIDRPITLTTGTVVGQRGLTSAGGIYEFAYGLVNDPEEAAYFPGHVIATIARARFGTLARTWMGRREDGFASQVGDPDPATTTQVYDLTIAKAMCEMLLERFRYGVPICKIVLGLNHGDIQEGDFVSFDDDRFLWLDHDGADSTVTWEVIGKRIQPIGDSPRVELTLAWVRSEAVPFVTLPETTWEIPISTPIYPVPTIPSSEPYTDLDGAPFTSVEGGWYFPT